MIEISDFIEVPFSEDAFNEGIEYANKSIFATFNRMGDRNVHRRAQRIISGIGIGEWAVKWFFEKYNIDFNLSGKTRWYEVDRSDFQIGSKRIDVKSFFIDKNQSFHIRNFYDLFDDIKSKILDCIFLVPQDQFRARNPKELYFCVVGMGQFLNKSKEKNVSYLWDYEWNKNSSPNGSQNPLGKIKINGNVNLKNIKIKLVGTKARKKHYTEEVILNENDIITSGEFFDLFTCYCEDNNPGDLTISSLNKNIKVNLKWQSHKYVNDKIFLVGFTTKEKLQCDAEIYPRFSRNTGFYSETKTDNLGIRCKNLFSIKNLHEYI